MVEFSHLTKAYKKRVIVGDFTLSVDAPIFGFLGQNGAGKTTIMKMVVGLLAPTSGTITIDGALSSHPIFKKKLGYMPETPYFYENMTGMEFLRFCDELFGPVEGKQFHYEEILRKVGIYDTRNFPIRTYSKGMRQRLGFAQSLVNDPEYLFLDEPLDGLDPIGRREMKEVMLGLKHEGRKVFLNTHILADVEEICDEVGVIHRGKLLYAGSVKAFCAGKPLEERFMEVVEEHERQHVIHEAAVEQHHKK
jgi:ABC-2 type transport system ATP-binding protein